MPAKGSHKDLVGKVFGNLTVQSYDGTSRHRQSMWKCRCACGNEIIVSQSNLVSGGSKSCGCIRKGNLVHGLSHTRIYNIWANMITRCYNKNAKSWVYYGGRGIAICDEWYDDVSAFYNWAIENGYSDDLTIDRIDNYKGYFPENCRWATKAEQNRNKRKHQREERT